MRLLLMAALLVAGTASSAEWVEVVKEKTGSVQYVDATAIQKDGQLRRFWNLRDLKEAAKGGSLSFRSFAEADCETSRMRLLQQEGFLGQMASGQTNGVMTKPTDWMFIAPGTSGDQVLKFVCAR